MEKEITRVDYHDNYTPNKITKIEEINKWLII